MWSTGPQLLRFLLVGAGGYASNLVAFTVLHDLTGAAQLAAAGAFLVAVAHNFAWNRRWTFAAVTGSPTRQAIRFVAVSLLALGATVGLLSLLAGPAAVPALLAEALATIAVAPITFAGSAWAFQVGVS